MMPLHKSTLYVDDRNTKCKTTTIIVLAYCFYNVNVNIIILPIGTKKSPDMLNGRSV